MTAGSLRVLWDSAETAQVTITGETATWTVGGNAVTFPYSMSSSTTFQPSRPGKYTLSVELFGVEIANTPDGTLDFEVQGTGQLQVAPTIDNTPAGNDFLSKVDDLTSGLIESGSSATAAALLASIARTDGRVSYIPIGDSFTGYNGGTSIATPPDGGNNPTVLDGKGMHNWANVFLKHDMVMLGNAGIGGQHSNQIAARFQTDVVAHHPDWVMILAGINDAVGEDTFGYLAQMYEAAEAAAIKVCAITIPPGFKTGGGSTVSSALQLHRMKVNSQIRDYARSHPNVVLADIAAAWQDYAAAGFLPIAAYVAADDGIHPTIAGAMAAGRVIAEAMRAHVPANRLRASIALGPHNLLTNPGLTGTGTTVPSGWGINTQTGVQTYAIVPRADGIAGWCLEVTSPANGVFKLISNVSVDGTKLRTGDVVDFGIEVEAYLMQTDAAMQYLTASLRQYNGGTLVTGTGAEAWDVKRAGGASYASGIALPDCDLGFRTPPLLVGGTTTLVQAGLEVSGGGVFRFKGPFVQNLTLIAAA